MRKIILVFLFSAAVETYAQTAITSGTSINISTGTQVTLLNDLANNGVISGNGKVVLSGGSQQILTGNGSVSNLELNNSAGATISPGQTVSITDSYTPTNGLLTTNNGLILKSSSAQTARIAEAANGTFSGKAYVERYIPASGNRAWRLLAVPIQTTAAPTIFDSWQESGSSPAGLGTHITQAGGAGVNGSFDAGPTSASGSSIRQYNNASNTLSAPSATSISIASQPAWFVFVRGDRSLNITSSTSVSSNTTLRIAGNLNTGSQNFSVPVSNYQLVGNPFASPFDFSLAIANAATSNVLNKFWVWDPKLNVNGGYVLFDGSLSTPYTPSVTGGSYSSPSSIIQSGQGFFVRSSGATGNLRIQEDDKVSFYLNVFKTTSGEPDVRVKLNVVDPSTFLFKAGDGVIGVFENGYSAGTDNDDGEKMVHFGANLAIVRNNKLLTIEKRPSATVTDTLHLALWAVPQGNYEFEIACNNFTSTALVPYIIDNYAHTSTQVSLSGSTHVSFNVTNDTASYGLNRFKVIFQNPQLLPVKDVALKARQKGEDIEVNWTVMNGADDDIYELERMVEGSSFETMTSVNSRNGTNFGDSFTWIDTEHFPGPRYYRIKILSAGSKAIFSNLFSLSMDNVPGRVVVNPNPVRDGTVGLEFIDMPSGAFRVEVFDNNGQQLLMKTIQNAGRRSNHFFACEHLKGKGVCYLKVSGAYFQNFQKIIIE